MKRIDLNRYTPMGYTSSNSALSITALIFAVINTVELPFNIIAARNDLYPNGRLVLGVIAGAKMATFRSLIGTSLRLFPLFWVTMALEVFSAYRYHKTGSRSIYLMRRLPDKWELHRRCWRRPLIYTAGSLALMAVILVFWYLMYLLITPAGCLPY